MPRGCDVPTYHLKVEKTISVSPSRVMYRVHHIKWHGLGPLHRWATTLDNLNGLSSYPSGDCKQKLCRREIDVHAYHVNIHKIMVITYSTVILRVHNIWRYAIGPFQYCSPCEGLSNGLLSDTNGDHLRKLCSREVDVQTYHFWFHKTIGISSYRVMFRVHRI